MNRYLSKFFLLAFITAMLSFASCAEQDGKKSETEISATEISVTDDEWVDFDEAAEEKNAAESACKSSCSGCSSSCGAFETTSQKSEQLVKDEFEEFHDFESNGDASDDFEEFNNDNVAGTVLSGDIKGNVGVNISSGLQWVLSILAFTILAGFLVRNPKTRKYRVFFLLASVVILGFYRGACPCPIMSFQNLILAIRGVDVSWQSLVWFIALIPITYFFGKVWCGWICHLGALQEFLFQGKMEILKGRKSQVVLRYIRYGVLAVLVAQLLITKTNVFVHYDPFKVAYNLFSASTLGYVLLGVLLVSSVFINRPFCRTVCPIGLVLGWVSLIPGASVIGVKKDMCVGCNQCNSACHIHAITRENKVSRLVNQDCIACGECLDACKNNGLAFFQLGKSHPNNVICKNEHLKN